jgi:hypothetical protein
MSNYAYFGAYIFYREKLAPGHEGALPLGLNIVVGALSGLTYWLSCYPVDVIKSRMQSTPLQHLNAGSGFWATARHTVTTGGWRALFRGLSPCLIRAVPANAACFTAYETVLYALPERLSEHAATSTRWSSLTALSARNLIQTWHPDVSFFDECFLVLKPFASQPEGGRNWKHLGKHTQTQHVLLRVADANTTACAPSYLPSDFCRVTFRKRSFGVSHRREERMAALDQEFLAATTFVAKYDGLQASNESKLKFYGLYKQATSVIRLWLWACSPTAWKWHCLRGFRDPVVVKLRHDSKLKRMLNGGGVAHRVNWGYRIVMGVFRQGFME